MIHLLLARLESAYSLDISTKSAILMTQGTWWPRNLISFYLLTYLIWKICQKFLIEKNSTVYKFIACNKSSVNSAHCFCSRHHAFLAHNKESP